jgi:histidyl-tRNA synthetase
MHTPDSVLAFWFIEHGEADWFGAKPEVDAEQLLMIWRLWERLGIPVADRPQLQLNSLGCTEERLAHRAALVEHFTRHAGLLDEDAKRRLQTNPLRILDTKNPAMAEVVQGAPTLDAFLGQASRSHQDWVCQALADASVPFVMNPRLVRGLDYYSHTAFEFTTTALGAQGAVIAGGRYDGLIGHMGGPETPAVGWAAGIERLAMLVVEPSADDVFTVIADAPELETDALIVSALLRQAGFAIERHFAAKTKRQIELSKKRGNAGIFFVKRVNVESPPYVYARYLTEDREEQIGLFERAAAAISGRYTLNASDLPG